MGYVTGTPWTAMGYIGAAAATSAAEAVIAPYTGSIASAVQPTDPDYTNTAALAAGAFPKTGGMFQGNIQAIANPGTVSINPTNTIGAMQLLLMDSGEATMAEGSAGVVQAGEVSEIGRMSVGAYSAGASQAGIADGVMEIGGGANGAMQRGRTQSGTATNNGVGALQLFDLGPGQEATTTADGAGSIVLGAGTATNKYVIVAGDGQVSHGAGSITAGGGFFGDAGGLTNVPGNVGFFASGTNILIVIGGTTNRVVLEAYP
jgi:hypothetical protein